MAFRLRLCHGLVHPPGTATTGSCRSAKLTKGMLRRTALTGAVQYEPEWDGRTITIQDQAVTKFGASGRTLDVLAGPAGTGKTTTMLAPGRTRERRCGAKSVVGLPPSATAADVLAGDLEIATENIAKWLHEHRRGKWNLTAGQLVVIDEASLAGIFAPDALNTQAQEMGAKVLLVGDWAQLEHRARRGSRGGMLLDFDRPG